MTTYFFAIFPEPRARDQTAAVGALVRDGLGLRGAPVPREKLHLTCHFVARTKDFNADLESRLIEVGDAVHADPFELVLTMAITFNNDGKAPSVLLPDATPPALARLVTALNKSSSAHAPPNPRPYQAHVTFLWGEDRIYTPMPITPVTWQASDFVLAASVPGEEPYRILKSWRLTRVN